MPILFISMKACLFVLPNGLFKKKSMSKTSRTVALNLAALARAAEGKNTMFLLKVLLRTSIGPSKLLSVRTSPLLYEKALIS